MTPERVASTLLKTPRLAFEVAPLLTWVAGSWEPVDGGHERRDPWGKVVAKTYDHSRVGHPPGQPWKWVAWVNPQAEGDGADEQVVMHDADEHLQRHGWTLVW